MENSNILCANLIQLESNLLLKNVEQRAATLYVKLY